MATQAQALKQIEKLAAKPRDRIRLAAALAKLIKEKPPSLTLNDLTEVTGKKLRTLNYLIYLGKRMDDLSLSEEQYVNIGWTKCVLIAKNCHDKQYAQTLVDVALDYTVDQLRQFFAEEPTTKTKSILLRLTDRQHKVFESVLLDHGASNADNGGLSNKEAALTKALKKLQTKS